MSYTELKVRFPVGRKDYSCEWCAQTIPKAEKHFHRTYIWENEFNDGRMHLECERAMHEVPREHLDEGWTPGDYARGSVDSI